MELPSQGALLKDEPAGYTKSQDALFFEHYLQCLLERKNDAHKRRCRVLCRYDLLKDVGSEGTMTTTISQEDIQERMGFKFIDGVGMEIWIACTTKDMERGIVRWSIKVFFIDEMLDKKGLGGSLLSRSQ